MKTEAIKILIFFNIIIFNSLLFAEVIENHKCLKSENRTHVCDINYVSIIKLISVGEKYHNKRVSISGIVSIGFEEGGVFLSKDDFEYRINRNAVGLELDGWDLKKLEKYNGVHVMIEGKFLDLETNGFSGLLSDVYLITPLPK